MENLISYPIMPGFNYPENVTVWVHPMFYPRKHTKLSYANQKRAAHKRTNVRKRSKKHVARLFRWS